METQHIRYLRSVADLGSISAAARELGMTQSALTKIVSRAEDIVNAPLFERRSRGVDLTAFGELYLSRTAKIEQEIHNLNHDILALKAGQGGTISIGVGQYWVGRIVPQVTAKFMEASPDVKIRIVTGERNDNLSRLQKGEFDFLLGQVVDDMPEDIVGEPLSDVKLYILVREKHPLALKDGEVTPDDLHSYGWALPASNDPTTILFNRIFTDLGFKPKSVAVEVVSRNLVAAMLQYTDLITIMPDTKINQVPAGLRRLEVDWLDWSGSTGLLSVKDRSLLPCCQRFMDLIRAETQLVIEANADD